MDFTFYYTAFLLMLMTVSLIMELMEADIIIFSALLLLVLGRVISVQEAFAGFSNQGMLTVGFLFIVAGGLQKTGILNDIGRMLLGRRAGSPQLKLIRLLFPVASISAFFNNTPIVAMLIPIVRSWARKNEYSVSKFLIPLSYAAILGGVCTLIGTSTNLVIHGLMLQNGFEGLSFFEISKIGIPVAIIGLLTLIFLGYHLLPERKELTVKLGESTREFVIAMKVGRKYPHIGKTIEEAGLRHLKGLFVFQIQRGEEIITPVTPHSHIHENDRLFFTGLPDTILELQRTPGLMLIKDTSLDLKNYDSDQIWSFEVVISPNSPLIGKNVRESNFRSRYNAVIVAIHRSGERIKSKIGDVVLHSGDTLLLLANKHFLDKWYHSEDFFLVSRSEEVPSKPQWKSVLSLIVLGAMIISMALKLLPILITVCLTAIVLLSTGCITPQDARDSVDWKVLLIIASSFGIATGMYNSGLAEFLAHTLISGMGTLGIIGLLIGVYFMTSLYTEIITNNAAAALLFPIALSVSQQAQINPRPFFLAVAMAASASFATPIGYQTNLMVYGPGGYRFRDFMKIGIPMNIFIGCLAVGMLYMWFFM